MEKDQQELMFKLSMFEQQIRAMQEQLQAVEQAVMEVTSLNYGLDELKGGKEKEILANIGKGIFIKAKTSSEELLVDVGGKNFVKKSIPETQKIMKEQVEKLEEIKADLEGKLEDINEELTQTFMDAQEKEKKKKEIN